ncbi:lipolytic enzyme [Ilyonectria robusta]|uniref:lipolytic enzyme n=1 Tax=Ilyonectria robusta TaxID=1079257 RepID=UPI001E8DBC33|nr:lipolytic enzyme [Ilyonectria robusta]KAH8667819.1 lipolytic enzyme [Ilyonectria robusta]
MLRSFILTALVAILGFGPTNALSGAKVSRDDTNWITVWGSMPQLTEPANLPPAPFNQTGRTFQNTTIRQTVKVSIKSSSLRLQISNAFGGSDLRLSAVSFALPTNASAAGGNAIKPSSDRKVTFSGKPTFVVPMGALVISDPIDISLDAGSIVTISIYLEQGQTTNQITSHPGSRTTSWLINGNHIHDAELEDAVAVDHWYYISALETKGPKKASTIAIVGDSLTDGRGSTTNANNRWPDQLLSRLQKNKQTSDVAILNQAAGGNRLLADGLGPNGLGRLDRDVIAHSGVEHAIFLIGINDIGTTAAESGPQAEIASRITGAYQQAVMRLHRHGISVYGGTLMPAAGKGNSYGLPAREEARQSINKWIRESGIFDAVIDFDAMVKNPDKENEILEEYDSGDGLHLNPAGYQAMADGIDLGLFF